MIVDMITLLQLDQAVKAVLWRLSKLEIYKVSSSLIGIDFIKEISKSLNPIFLGITLPSLSLVFQ